jgi:hypothetical protein
MRRYTLLPLFGACAMSTMVALWPANSYAQELPMEGPAPTTATVRVEAKHEATLNPAMLKLEINGRQTPIESLNPVQPAQAQLAILIDDGLRGSFGLQLDDVAGLIQKLPAGMQVLVGYMRNGEVANHGFTTDRTATLNDLRIPVSVGGISASPYFALSEFVKHWPGRGRGPRFVLMITNGVDPYNGSVSPLNQDSPYVERAQEDAQRAGVAVYSVYYPIHGERGELVSFSGQSYLQQVGQATGGESLYTGNITPVSLQPFLDRFRKDLSESYTLSFRASVNADHPNSLARVKVKSEQPDVKVHAPDGVLPGMAE